MLTKYTGHGVDRNVKGFGGMDRVPCKIMKQWEVRLLLYSTQSVLVMIVNCLSFSSQIARQLYHFSHSDNISKRPNRFIKELDDLINDQRM